ncbi:MAG: DUF2254 domain-containing protein [Chloroflexi bacterium]|nr:DUF2254 domain-containing protein [Chloroflexota bacterium]
MRTELLERIAPFGLIAVFGALIAVRISNVLHIGIANTIIGNVQWVLAGSGIGGIAAIFAIIMSISIMAVQFASQEYTHRIMNAYMKSSTFWSLIIIYIGTLIYNIYFTGSIEDPANPVIADVSILLQILCFLMLVPHFISTTSQLNPNYIINKILRTVNKDYISSLERYYKDEKINVPSNMDRVLPVVEIVEKAIIKGDRDTTRTTVDKLYKAYKSFTQNGRPAWISQYFMAYLLRIGQQGVLSEDDDIVVRVIKLFGEIGASSGSDEAIENAQMLAAGALKKDYDMAVQQAIDSLLLMLRASASLEATNKIHGILNDMADDLFEIGKPRLVSYLLQQINASSNAMADSGNRLAVEKSIELLERIGLTAAQKGLTDIEHRCIQAFHKIGTVSVGKGVLSEEGIIGSLIRIERSIPAEQREFKSEIDYVIKDIEKLAPKKSPEEAEKVALDVSDLWLESDD